MVELEVTCNCGHSWKTILERRRYFRKNVNFSGTYRYQAKGDNDPSDAMTVVDISRKGLKLKIAAGDVRFEKGDRFEVAFPLDNDANTLIKRNVIVTNVFENFLGVEFRDTIQEDTDIALYMSRQATN